MYICYLLGRVGETSRKSEKVMNYFICYLINVSKMWQKKIK